MNETMANVLLGPSGSVAWPGCLCVQARVVIVDVFKVKYQSIVMVDLSSAFWAFRTCCLAWVSVFNNTKPSSRSWRPKQHSDHIQLHDFHIHLCLHAQASGCAFVRKELDGSFLAKLHYLRCRVSQRLVFQFMI